MKKVLAPAISCLILVLSGAAHAAGVAPLPEPGTFELLALSGVVALIIGIRNRRRK